MLDFIPVNKSLRKSTIIDSVYQKLGRKTFTCVTDAKTLETKKAIRRVVTGNQDEFIHSFNKLSDELTIEKFESPLGNVEIKTDKRDKILSYDNPNFLNIIQDTLEAIEKAFSVK